MVEKKNHGAISKEIREREIQKLNFAAHKVNSIPVIYNKDIFLEVANAFCQLESYQNESSNEIKENKTTN